MMGGGAHGCQDIFQKAMVERGCGVAGEGRDEAGLGAAGDGLLGHDKQGAAEGIADLRREGGRQERAAVR